MNTADELINACNRIHKSDPETWSIDCQNDDGTMQMVHQHLSLEVRVSADFTSVHFAGLCIYESETGLPWDDDKEDYIDIEDHLRAERKKVLDALTKFCTRLGGVA